MLGKCHLVCIISQQRIKTKQKQAKNEHNVRWKPLSARDVNTNNVNKT
jgi:hypothetical protein